MWIWPGCSLVDAISFTLEHMRRPGFIFVSEQVCLPGYLVYLPLVQKFFPSWLVANLWDDIFTHPVPQQHPQWVYQPLEIFAWTSCYTGVLWWFSDSLLCLLPGIFSKGVFYFSLCFYPSLPLFFKWGVSRGLRYSYVFNVLESIILPDVQSG